MFPLEMRPSHEMQVVCVFRKLFCNHKLAEGVFLLYVWHSCCNIQLLPLDVLHEMVKCK